MGWKYPKKEFLYEKRVLLKQTNAFGNVYFSSHLEWQGEARESFLFEHPDIANYLKETKHLKMITHSLYHKFHQNAYFGDRIKIIITSKNILKYSFILNFDSYSLPDNKPIGSGWQKIGFYDDERKCIAPVPSLFLDLLLPVLRVENASDS